MIAADSAITLERTAGEPASPVHCTVAGHTVPGCALDTILASQLLASGGCGLMRGFTLIELVGRYNNHRRAGGDRAAWLPVRQASPQRTDARLALLWVQHQQERHYAAHNTYATQAGATDRSARGDYDIAVTLTVGGQGFVATARANASGRQAGDHPAAGIRSMKPGNAGRQRQQACLERRRPESMLELGSSTLRRGSARAGCAAG